MKLNTQNTQSLSSCSTSFSVGLVNYKTLDLTKHCLTLLKKHLDDGALNAAQVQVWVVDNDSQDESTAYLKGLDWIHLIERPVTEKEQGFAAHGKGLDLILANVQTDYLFLIHTDTLIYDAEVFSQVLALAKSRPKVAAVGCLHQLNRGYLRTAWRTLNGFFKYYFRSIKVALGLPSREPKPYIEPYIKSFFALWDIALMKQLGFTFFMENRIPGYALQDYLQEKGYEVRSVSPMWLFQFLDHVEAGTVGLVAGYSAANRRAIRKQSILQKLDGLGR